MARDPRIVDNLKPFREDRAIIPRASSGSVLGPLSQPAVVGAAAASHMRDADYVVGLVHKGSARAYPLWIVDYYHAVNDTIAGDRIAFFA